MKVKWPFLKQLLIFNYLWTSAKHFPDKHFALKLINHVSKQTNFLLHDQEISCSFCYDLWVLWTAHKKEIY